MTTTTFAPVPFAPAAPANQPMDMADVLAQPAEHDAAPARANRKVTKAIKAAISLLGLGALALYLDGVVASYRAVNAEMAPYFGYTSWTVPTGIDLGIGIVAGIDILLAYLDHSVWWLKWVPRALTAATIVMNEQAGGDLAARIAHGVLPSLAIVCVEVAVKVVRQRIGLETDTRRDAIPTARWVYSPIRTFRLNRRMVLWRINSYPVALDRELLRLAGESRAKALYGPAWKRTMPGEVRLLLELGKIGPDDIPGPMVLPGPGDQAAPAAGPVPPVPGDRSPFEAGPRGPQDGDGGDRSAPEAGPRGRTTGTDGDRRPAFRRPRPELAVPDEPQDVLDAAVAAARELIRAEQPVNRNTLKAALKTAGHDLGNRRMGPVLAYAKEMAAQASQQVNP